MAEVAKATAASPLTFGASLLAIAPIVAAAAIGIGALEVLKGKIRNSFAEGSNYIPYDMQAQVHQGEIIVPKNFSDAIRSGDLSLGRGSGSSSGGDTIVNVYLDGKLITRQVSETLYGNTRRLVKSNFAGVL